MKPKFYTFWAINAPLDERELCRQLEQMCVAGFDGTVWHPRFYPNQPPYLSDEYLGILSRTILHAKSVGLEFWIYDEDGWPSGTVGGELLRHHPDCRQQWRTADGQIHHGDGVDYLNPDLARHFLELTYERYRQGLSPAAWDHVTAFFCDEPEFGLGHAYDKLPPRGAIPWTTGMKESWFDTDDRVRFWEALTDRFCEAFIEPINAWCQQHGKCFTGHVKGEEHPLFQVPMHGSLHQVLRRMSLPGIDALERFPSGHFYPRQVASAAQQFGNGECMVECFGGAGWGVTPEDLERYLNWLIGHGLTHFVCHLWQYRLISAAVRDWPPSQPVHLNWRDAYPTLLSRVRHRTVADAPRADTLVVAPYRGIMATFEPWELMQTNVHNAATYPDTPAGRLNTGFLELLDGVHASGAAYHVCDERTVDEHGRTENGQLRIGNCRYQHVIVADGAMLKLQVGAASAPFPQRGATGTPPSPSPPSLAVPVRWTLAQPVLNYLVTDDPLQAEQGHFLVRSLTPYMPGPNGTVMTDGPFRTEPVTPLDGADLIAAGYPFCRGPFQLTADFEFRPSPRLQLIGIAADCARLWIDDCDLGWNWGPDWSWSLPDGFATGAHGLRLELIPSTYNFFGPHRYVGGDHPIVTPGQYEGKNNFADRADAPAITHVSAWHFRPVRVPSHLRW